MASKKQLKEYSQYLEALVLLYSTGEDNMASIVNILSDNVSFEVKLQTAKALSKLKTKGDFVDILKSYRNHFSS